MKKLTLAAAAAVLLASGANATLINLDSLATGSLTASVRIGDYILTPALHGSATPLIQAVNGHNVIVGTNGSSGDDTYLTRADGGVFTLDSVVIGLISGAGATGQNVNNGVTTHDLSRIASATPQTISFGSQFANVTQIDLDALYGAYFTSINVTAPAASSSAVPETATWGMMILGLGLIGAALRPSKRQTKVIFG